MAIIKSHSPSLTFIICPFVRIAQIAQIRTTETTPYPTPPLLSYYVTLSRRVLNNFCFHVYVQKSLFIAENLNVFLYYHDQHHTHLPLWVLSSWSRFLAKNMYSLSMYWFVTHVLNVIISQQQKQFVLNNTFTLSMMEII